MRRVTPPGEGQETCLPNLSDKMVLDSNAMTHLNEALSPAYDPATDLSGFCGERIALLRAYLHLDYIPWIVPMVDAEYQHIAHQPRLVSHTLMAHVFLNEVTEPLDSAVIDARVAELSTRHPRKDDCRVVAEAEAIGGDVLLTCDLALLRKLAPVAKIALYRPSEFWAQLAVPRGRRPPRDILDHTSHRDRWWDW